MKFLEDLTNTSKTMRATMVEYQTIMLTKPPTQSSHKIAKVKGSYFLCTHVDSKESVQNPHRQNAITQNKDSLPYTPCQELQRHW